MTSPGASIALAVVAVSVSSRFSRTASGASISMPACGTVSATRLVSANGIGILNTRTWFSPAWGNGCRKRSSTLYLPPLLNLRK